MSAVDVLFFVEDPGAANYVAALPEALHAQGLTTRLLAGAKAAEQLANLHVAFERSLASPAERLDQALPRSVVVGTSENRDSAALALVTECRTRGIPSIAVIDGPADPEWRFRGRTDDPRAHAPDWLLVPDEVIRQSYVRLGFLPATVIVCGHPHYDWLFAQRAILERADRAALRRALVPAAADRPVVLVLAEQLSGLHTAEYLRAPEDTLHGRGGSPHRIHIVIEEVLDALSAAAVDPFVVLRLHPKNTVDELQPYVGEVDQISQGGAAHALVFASDLVIGCSTFLLVEAAALGRPTLCVVTRAGETQPLTVRLGITPAVADREALRGAIRGALTGKLAPPPALDRYLPTGSTSRVVEVIQGVLATGPAKAR